MVLEPPLIGSRLSGAAFRLRRSRLIRDRKMLKVDVGGATLENEADLFAREMLVPQDAYRGRTRDWPQSGSVSKAG